MTIRHLRVFVTVAECGKMRTAAKELFVAQPAVSQTISELEQHYNTRLFERLSHKLYITPAGEQLLSYAKHILSLYDEMELNMHSSTEKSEIRIGATIMVGTCLIVPILNRYAELHPLVGTSIYISNNDVLRERLLNSELDFVLVEGSFSDPNFIVEPVLDDPMVLICGLKHEFAKRKSVTLEEVSQASFIGREKGEKQELFDEFLIGKNLTTNTKWISNNSETTKKAVMANRGITLISKRIVADEIAKDLVHVVSVEKCHIVRKVQLVYHKNKYISKPLEDLLALCRKVEELVPEC
ncbi:MAG: LysR family transcriptional regulator [Oscillospiraceae bacterium]